MYQQWAASQAGQAGAGGAAAPGAPGASASPAPPPPSEAAPPPPPPSAAPPPPPPSGPPGASGYSAVSLVVNRKVIPELTLFRCPRRPGSSSIPEYLASLGVQVVFS
jgi:hypothetical protein